jgi:hypothetical protein
MGDTEPAEVWKRKEGLAPPIAAIAAAPAGVRICALPDREDSEVGAKAGRLFGGHGDRPRFEARPRSSPRYRRVG